MSKKNMNKYNMNKDLVIVHIHERLHYLPNMQFDRTLIKPTEIMDLLNVTPWYKET